MAEGRQLLWINKSYFRGWTCTECLWRSEGFRWNRDSEPYPGIRAEFEGHDCSRHQNPAACLSPLAFES